MWTIITSQESWFHTQKTVWEIKLLFYIQRNIGDFHKGFYIQQIEKIAYHWSYYKILGKIHAADVRYK